MKLKSSTKIAIGFIALGVASWGGFRFYTTQRLSSLKLPELAPSRVNLLAVAPDKGYRIVVANQMAQLWKFSREIEKPDDITDASSDIESRKRIPIAEMLKAMQGDEKALSSLVMAMNDLKEDDLPAKPIVWKSEDVLKALDGDVTLRSKLQADLQMTLDGNPMTTFTFSAIEDGIVLDLPVRVKVKVGTEERTLTARILQNYRPQFMALVSKKIEDMGVDVGKEQIGGIYAQMIEDLRKPDTKLPKEDIVKTLRDQINTARLQKYAEAPEQILSSTSVIATEAHTVRAESREYGRAGKQPLYELKIELTSEGRDRLWKYSHDRVGNQILVVVDGIPVAAPRIQHEMLQTEVVINKLGDKTLAQDAADTINQLSKTGVAKN